jgi:hypothetical protein
MVKKTPNGPCMFVDGVERDEGEHSAVCIVKSDYGTVNGWVSYENVFNDHVYVNAWVYVQRCQAIDNHPENCTTIAANSKGDWTSYDGTWLLETSKKEAQYGWIYRACASLNVDETYFEYVNVCSPFVTGNPDARISYILPLPV